MLNRNLYLIARLNVFIYSLVVKVSKSINGIIIYKEASKETHRFGCRNLR